MGYSGRKPCDYKHHTRGRVVLHQQARSNHAVLQKARKELGLDFVAFDYGYEKEGNLVVWEAKYIRFSTGKLTYRNAALDKTLLAILKMYLKSASLPIPGKMDQQLAY